MQILETRIYRGPNLYGYRPVIRLTLDLQELEDYPTNKLPGIVDGLLAAVPSLEEHGCSYGEPGGFVKRLREGTWLGHVVEHTALELQCLAGTPVTYGKCRGAGSRGIYHVIYSYEDERVGLRAGDLAIELVRSLLPPELPAARGAAQPFVFAAELEGLCTLAERLALGPSTRSLVMAARERDIPYLRLDDRSFVQLGWGVHQRRIRATVTSTTSHLAVETAQDKDLTKRLLEHAGIPVPRSSVVQSEDEAIAEARRLGFPIVVKPLDLSHGRGVSLDLRNEGQVREAVAEALALTDQLLVEEMVQGDDHRVLVVGDRVVAATRRIPGHVVGDGHSTIGELVTQLNADPRRGVGHEKPLTRIEIDHQAQRLLALAGYTLETVLPAGVEFRLRSTGNISTGGTAEDCTDRLHPDNADLAVRAARVIGLDIAGIDMITRDIAAPLRDVGGAIVEVNAAPGFRMHLEPTIGRPRDPAGPVLDMLFPPGTPGRIPIAAITGTNGKTTTSRMVAHILKMAGRRVGLTTTDGIYIDGQRFLAGDMTGPWSARVVLRDPTVEVAVLETARGGILREGIGFDRCDVGAVLNVTRDHIGLKGVETLEDLAYVKRLVLEIVREDGCGVINADDPLVLAMREEIAGETMLFSMQPDNEAVREHVGRGGRAVVVAPGINGRMITLYDGERQIPVVWSHLIPATLEGRATFQVQNAAAATAIAFALGLPLEQVRQGLRTFDCTYFQTPGRLNLFSEHPFRVIVDYGHNHAAMVAMCDLVRQLRRRQAIGVIMCPGDRPDIDIRALAQVAGATFDHIIAKEGTTLRGRVPGTVAALLADGAAQGGCPSAHIEKISSEEEAVQRALTMAQPDDLVVIFADEVPDVWKQVIYFGGRQPRPGMLGEGR